MQEAGSFEAPRSWDSNSWRKVEKDTWKDYKEYNRQEERAGRWKEGKCTEQKRAEQELGSST